MPLLVELVEYEHGVLVLAVADRPGVLEAVLLQEAYGGGVAGEGVGVQGRFFSRRRKRVRASVAMPRPQYGRPNQ